MKTLQHGKAVELAGPGELVRVRRVQLQAVLQSRFVGEGMTDELALVAARKATESMVIDSPGDRAPLQMLAILVEMIDLYCPSLANSGGVSEARAMCAGVPRDRFNDEAIRTAAADMRRYLDANDSTYDGNDDNTSVGVDDHVNLVALARAVFAPHLKKEG